MPESRPREGSAVEIHTLPDLQSQMRALHAKCRTRLQELRDAAGQQRARMACGRVRELVLVASSSRGGSTVTTQALRHSPELLHLPAEINPYLHLANLVWPLTSHNHDGLSVADLVPEARACLDEQLSWEIGRRRGHLHDDEALHHFALQLACRLTLQWPYEEFDFGVVFGQMQTTLRWLEQHEGWQRGEWRNSDAFFVRFLVEVRKTHPRVNPWYYDLHPRLIEHHHPDLVPQQGPPSPLLIEEPPFVTIEPWEPADSDEALERPLLIKTPGNAYRLEALAHCFPQARLRVLHLVRHGGASLNGLMDGWHYRGFHAHRLVEPHGLQGLHGEDPSSPFWWKFDLPPGWQQVAHGPLLEACFLQWSAAHRAILDYARPLTSNNYHRVCFEDLVAQGPVATRTWGTLGDWLGADLLERLQATLSAGLPPTMSTQGTQHARWLQRWEQLSPYLQRSDFRQLTEELGYDAASLSKP